MKATFSAGFFYPASLWITDDLIEYSTSVNTQGPQLCNFWKCLCPHHRPSGSSGFWGVLEELTCLVYMADIGDRCSRTCRLPWALFPAGGPHCPCHHFPPNYQLSISEFLWGLQFGLFLLLCSTFLTSCFFLPFFAPDSNPPWLRIPSSSFFFCLITRPWLRGKFILKVMKFKLLELVRNTERIFKNRNIMEVHKQLINRRTIRLFRI